MFKHPERARWLALLVLLSFLSPAFAFAAESTTGSVVGSVQDRAGAPIANVKVTAIAPSGRYTAVTDSHGAFSMFGIFPDTYIVSASDAGYEAVEHAGVTVLPGQAQSVTFVLEKTFKTIATVKSSGRSFAVGSTSDTFTVTGDQARATYPENGASGLATYSQGTVQGSITSVPGVDQDAFANAILRGGKIEDSVFDFDSVPIPQGLVAEPGGAITGAQLFTTGIGAVTTTLAGFESEGQNALGGVIDMIPTVGTYPGHTTVDVLDSLPALDQGFSFQSLWATPDLKWRYAVSLDSEAQYLAFGDGHSFYAPEGGYGLALQTRGEFSTSANIHYQLKPHDDLSFVVLFGEGNYHMYDTPFTGETYGYLNGQHTIFPGVPDQNAFVTVPASVRGTYDVLKAQWVHTSAHSLARLQIFQSQFGSLSQGSWWDDDSFPDGQISLYATQGGREEGIGYDIDDVASPQHHFKYGVQYTTNNSFLNQVVPTADEYITSNPNIFNQLLYAGDTWSMGSRVDVTGVLRANFNYIVPSAAGAVPYSDNSIDPHLATSYRFGNNLAFRATYDHTTVAPKPLEADRTDSTNVQANGSPAPFVPLAAETANNFTYSLEGGGKTQFRITYFDENEKNRIDVLPVNFREAVSAGQNPLGVGVPTNVGQLKAKGAELWLKRGGFSFDANYIRGYSSSAAQFAYNDLNAAAIAAGHLFPLGYIPDFTAILSYEQDFVHHRIRFTPSLEYESGYPYGNGTKIWIFGPDGKPEAVNNDNNLNPGYNYYFLMNPACPLNEVPVKPLTPGKKASTCIPGYNPYIGNLGMNEGADPNTLRSIPQLMTGIHLEGDLNPRVTAILDVSNLFGIDLPQQGLGNQYLIGPPGYKGGNPYYEYWYAQQVGCPGVKSYTFGNGIPTNCFLDASGQGSIRQSVPWTYGTNGYIALGYPNARSIQFRLRYRL
jgi:Carboxypeptidase regulatory-like domain